MTLVRGRVVRAAETGAATAVATPSPSSTGWGRRVAREVVVAHAEAARIVAGAEAEAKALVAEAAREAQVEVSRALDAMIAEERARFAAMYVAMRAEDERRAERDQERAVAVAVALAERIVGRQIQMEPAVVVELAQRAVAEARGARRVVLEASPEDAATLREHLALLGLPEGSTEVRETSTLGRGDLCLHTDLGTLHARIATQLERLAEALRDVLGRR